MIRHAATVPPGRRPLMRHNSSVSRWRAAIFRNSPGRVDRQAQRQELSRLVQADSSRLKPRSRQRCTNPRHCRCSGPYASEDGERTLGRLGRWQRLANDHEALPEAAEAMADRKPADRLIPIAGAQRSVQACLPALVQKCREGSLAAVGRPGILGDRPRQHKGWAG
jgi:hypothetical protein